MSTSRFNFAELQADRLQVRLLGVFKVNVAYADIKEVTAGVRHRWFLHVRFSQYAVMPFEEHVDVVVQPRGFRSAWRLMGWTPMSAMHLALHEPERFAAALRERIEHSGVSKADGL